MPAVIAPIRYVGNPDFHDGHVQTVAAAGNNLVVTIVGCTGSKYTVLFRSVAALEMHSPEGMTLYALGELDSETPGLSSSIPTQMNLQTTGRKLDWSF